MAEYAEREGVHDLLWTTAERRGGCAADSSCVAGSRGVLQRLVGDELGGEVSSAFLPRSDMHGRWEGSEENGEIYAARGVEDEERRTNSRVRVIEVNFCSLEEGFSFFVLILVCFTYNGLNILFLLCVAVSNSGKPHYSNK